MRYYKARTKKVELSIILEAVCEYFNIPEKSIIFQNTRRMAIARPRQWFHYFSRILNPEFEISSAYIGQYSETINGRKYDHATVLNSIKIIKGYVDTYKDWKDVNNEILYLIKIKSAKFNGNGLIGNCAEQPFKITRYHETSTRNIENRI